jgi:hypothetical protein
MNEIALRTAARRWCADLGAAPYLSIYRFVRWRRLLAAANVLFDNICPLVYLPWQTRSKRTIDPRQRFQRRDPRY